MYKTKIDEKLMKLNFCFIVVKPISNIKNTELIFHRTKMYTASSRLDLEALDEDLQNWLDKFVELFFEI